MGSEMCIRDRPCLQAGGQVTIEGWAVTGAGTAEERLSERTTWTRALGGCPEVPSLTLEDLENGGDYRISWATEIGASAFLSYPGATERPVAGAQSITVSGRTGVLATVTVWACNQFGCSSIEKTTRPTAPAPTTVRLRSWTGGAPTFPTFPATGAMVRAPGDAWIQIQCKRFTANDPLAGSGGNGWFFLLAHPEFEGRWGSATNYDSRSPGEPFVITDTPESSVRECVAGRDY